MLFAGILDEFCSQEKRKPTKLWTPLFLTNPGDIEKPFRKKQRLSKKKSKQIGAIIIPLNVEAIPEEPNFSFFVFIRDLFNESVTA